MCSLAQFNQRVLQCQDDAYTLAWYLLGDETEAEAVMQKAVQAAYPCFSSHTNDCRLLILKQVVDQCREQKRDVHGLTIMRTPCDLHFLDTSEHLVLVLINILGLDYIDAALVVGCHMQDVRRLLAQARRKMMTQKEFASS